MGGLLTFFYFADHDISDQRGLWPLYVVFLACIIGGGAVTQLLSKGGAATAAGDGAATPYVEHSPDAPVNGAAAASESLAEGDWCVSTVD